MLRTRVAIELNERANCFVSIGPCSETSVDKSPAAILSVAFLKTVIGREISEANINAANTAIARETAAARASDRTRSATRASMVLFG